MQDAYAVEADSVGTWAQIGYTGPGSNTSSKAQSAVFKYDEVAKSGENAGWSAKPAFAKLNDCETTEGWTLNAQFQRTGTNQGNVGYKAAGDKDCTDLTPAWDKLDDGRTSS